MESPSEPRIRKRTLIFLLLGIVFEFLLIFIYFFQFDSWLGIEAHNFVVITHYPMMWLVREGLEIFGFRTELDLMFLGIGVMALIWAGLMAWLVQWWPRISARLNLDRRRKRLLGLGLFLGVIAMVGFNLWPASPRPFIATADVQAVVSGNTQFAIDLYHQLDTKPGNLFFSPYSISATLALAAAGAQGATQNEITNAIHLALKPEELASGFGCLKQRMAAVERWNHIDLKPASSVWLQQDYHFTDVFLRLANIGFGATARQVDFWKSPTAAGDEINQWIDRQSRHKIPKMVTPTQFDAMTRMVLCDALYFKGGWQKAFKPGDTTPAPFYLSKNETVTVPMMHEEGQLRFAKSDDESVEVLELPYYGNDLSMIIIKPGPSLEESGDDVGTELTAENLRSWLAKLDEHGSWTVSLSMPRFAMEQAIDVEPALKSLGIVTPFDLKQADFSGMDGTRHLYISALLHQSYVEVNEKGTEARAMTMLELRSNEAMEERVTLDHPFVFLIRDTGSGTILFMGRVKNPLE